MFYLKPRTIAAAALFLTLPGCASSSAASGESKAPPSTASQDKITSIEISGTSGATAYELVSRLRPAWLRAGAAGSMGGGRITQQTTLVYLDGTRMGSLEALRTIQSAGIRSMQWISSIRASVVLRDVGSEPITGVISISTEK